jgi:hypothetical protein
VPLVQVEPPFAGLVHGVHWVPHEAVLLSGTHLSPQRWKPALHLKAQALPSQVASVLAGTEQGMQEVVPQLFTSVLSTQFPLQSCLPAGQSPPHDIEGGWHLPVLLQSVVPEGQVAWQEPFMQAAPPPSAGLHGVHDVPHESVDVLDLHSVPQRWKPVLQVSLHSVPSQVVAPFGEVGHTTHEGPQAVFSVSATQRPLQGFFP